MRFFREIAAATALMLLAGQACGADPAPAKTQLFQLPEGARVHDVAPAPDGKIWYTAQRQGALGILDPEDRRDPAGAARRGIGAARRDPGAGRRGLDHRRRLERDRPLRSEDREDQRLEASGGHRLRQSQHRRLRRRRHPLVHRPERHLRPARSEDRRDGGLQGSRRPRPLWHRRDARRARSIMSRSPAAISPGSIARPARRRSSSRRPRTRARAGSGPTARATSGSPNGTAAISAATRPPPAPGRAGSCPATSPRPMPSMSTSATSSGSAISAPTRPWPSIRDRAMDELSRAAAEGANVRQILGRPGEVYLPESGTDRIMVVRTGGPG